MSAITTQNQEASRELAPLLNERFALNQRQMAVCLLFCLFFMYLNYLPLFHSDIWCHVHYGHWIIDNGQLPGEDPFMPLAAGMKVVDNA